MRRYRRNSNKLNNLITENKSVIFIDWNNILHGNMHTTDYYYYYIPLKTLKLTQEHHSVILHTESWQSYGYQGIITLTTFTDIT